MLKRIPIPLFYSIFVTLIVLVSMSVTSYLLLKTKYNTIQNSIISQSQTIFASLQESVKNQNQVAIQEIITSIGKNYQKILIGSSIIVYPVGYYYSSTNSDLLGKNVNANLKNLLKNRKNIEPIQQIKTATGVAYQTIITINRFQDGQIWFLQNIFDKNFFDTQFNNFRLLLVFVSILTVLFTFFFIYTASHFLLSQKLIAINSQIVDLLKLKQPQNIPNSLKEISLVSKKLSKLFKIFHGQKESIKELEADLQNPLKKKAVEGGFFNENYLCVLIKLDYSLSCNGKDQVNLKGFLLEISHLIIKTTQEQRVKLSHFGNYFLLVLDIKNFFSMGIQAIKDIEKKIHPNAAQFQKFGIKNLKCSMAVHCGKIYSMGINEEGMEDSVFYYGSTNYILHDIINKAKSKEILITQSVILYLSDKEKYTDINVGVNYSEEKHKVYLLGKQDKKLAKDIAVESFAKDQNPLSVNSMLEETFRQ